MGWLHRDSGRSRLNDASPPYNSEPPVIASAEWRSACHREEACNRGDLHVNLSLRTSVVTRSVLFRKKSKLLAGHTKQYLYNPLVLFVRTYFRLSRPLPNHCLVPQQHFSWQRSCYTRRAGCDSLISLNLPYNRYSQLTTNSPLRSVPWFNLLPLRWVG